MKILNHAVYGQIIYENKNIDSMKTLVEEAIRENISLAYANLDYTDLNFANLSNGNFSNAHLKGARLQVVHVNNGNFEGADMCNCLLVSSSFVNCNFKRTELRFADLCGVNFDGSNMMEADITGAKLTNAISKREKWLKKTNFNKALNLKDVIYDKDIMKRKLQANIDHMEESLNKNNFGNIIFW